MASYDEALHEIVRRALAEDRADNDVTTLAVVPADARGTATLIADEACVLAGMDVFAHAFSAVDAAVAIEPHAEDGDDIRAGATVATVRGPLRAILTAERTALNFVQRLSGIATLTRAFVDAAPSVEILDTRKTTPGLRALEKAAVRAGGGVNHRANLAEAILVKDNHIAAAGSIGEAVARAKTSGMSVQVECDTLEHVRAAIDAGADALLLDNMDPSMLADAVAVVAGRARTEASGGVRLDSVAAIAKTGVDSISVGALTHSAPSIDLTLAVEGG